MVFTPRPLQQGSSISLCEIKMATPRTPKRSYSRTDADVRVEYPQHHELQASKPVSGQGGQFSKPTLASLSLDGKVIVITGGARGLGLVMGQGCVYSGASLAIVDLNSKQ